MKNKANNLFHLVAGKRQASRLSYSSFKTLVWALFLFTGITTPVKAQPAIEWQKCLGGSSFDEAYYIQQTIDGGFVVAGYSQSNDGDVSGNHGFPDYWIVKLNASGNIEWQKCLGGFNEDIAKSIEQTTDGGFVVAGYSYSHDGDVSGTYGYENYWIVKLDTSGNIQWQKCLGGSGYNEAYSVQQTTDGGFVVAGITQSNDGDVSGNHLDDYGNPTYDYWIVKLDTSGNIQWQKCLGGSGDEWAYSIRQTSDGGFVVAGFSNSTDGDVSGIHGSYGEDCWIVKLDTSGNIQWQKCLGGSNTDWAYSIQQTNDGGFVVAGWSWSNDGDVSGNHGGSDYWIVKLDASGNIQWQKCLGGSYNDLVTTIQQTTDGGFVAAGFSNSNDGDISGNHYDNYPTEDYWIVKLDTSRNIQWQKCLGGSYTDRAYSIQQTSDEGFVVAGFSFSFNGDVSGNHGQEDCWVVKLGSFNGVISLNTGLFDWSLFPNPATDNLSIQVTTSLHESLSIKLFDLPGREAYSSDLGEMNGTFTRQLDLGNLPSGTYFLQVMHNGASEMKKVMIEK